MGFVRQRAGARVDAEEVVQLAIQRALERVALSVAGAAAGASLSLLTPLLEFATVNFATQQEVVFHFTPGAEILLGSIATGAVLGVLAGILPAVRAARITPSQAMRA